MASKPAVVVVCGGCSPEHEVSCTSTGFVLQKLLAADYELLVIGISRANIWYLQNIDNFIAQPQVQETNPLPYGFYPHTGAFFHHLGLGHRLQEIVMFPVLHGQQGEDGSIQGLFALSDVPYVGSDMLGSAIALNKIVAKKLAAEAGINVVKSVGFSHHDWDSAPKLYLEKIKTNLDFPLFVKPASTGSSVGISQVASEDELIAAINFALRYGTDVLIERAVDATEIQCAIIGDLVPEAAAQIGEISLLSGFYDYKTKYTDYSRVKIFVPARISAEQTQEVRQQAEKIFCTLNLHGLARIDFFLDRQNNQLYFSEVNTMPGCTRTSLFPTLWRESGVDGSALFSRIIDFAQARQQRLVGHEQHIRG